MSFGLKPVLFENHAIDLRIAPIPKTINWSKNLHTELQI
jgi:hypothetical protein